MSPGAVSFSTRGRFPSPLTTSLRCLCAIVSKGEPQRAWSSLHRPHAEFFTRSPSIHPESSFTCIAMLGRGLSRHEGILQLRKQSILQSPKLVALCVRGGDDEIHE